MTSFLRDALQKFVVDSNSALEFKLIRKSEDVDDESLAFSPEMSHQVFGDNESVFGYQDLKIKLYYTAGNLSTYLGTEYKKKINPAQFDGATADDITGMISEKIPAGYSTNMDEFLKQLKKEKSFMPFGEMLHSHKINPGEASERCFEFYLCDIEAPRFREFHERLQTFLLWYIDAASYIDADDHKWRYYLVFEKYKIDGEYRYATCGYATVYLYYAYPNNLRPRISQFLVLPPFQKLGLGAELLDVIYRSFSKDDQIVDVTVEDPSDDFVRLRDFVDTRNCSKLEPFQPEKLRQGFSPFMVQEARDKLKLNKKQVRRVYEILRFRATNTADAQEYRNYRLDIKNRLNIPYQKEASDFNKLKRALNAEELKSAMSTMNKEQRLENLERQYRTLEDHYKHVLERLAAAALH
nr:EOG090X06NC [Eulimnadia texana]